MRKLMIGMTALALGVIATPATAGFTFKAQPGSCRASGDENSFTLSYVITRQGTPVNRAILVLEPNITPMGESGKDLAAQVKLGGGNANELVDVTLSNPAGGASVYDMGLGKLNYAFTLPLEEIEKFEGKTYLVVMFDDQIISYHEFEGPLVAPLKECAKRR